MDPIPAWARKLWGAWDVRILVLLSLTLQIILCIFGHRRKYIKSQWISILVWSAYLMADWVATVALGKLSDESTSNNNNTIALRAIWAPLLLLHLGGPDTITAYSLEDNQLWMRHLMELGVQLVVAVYVILTSWRNFRFSYFSFPALVAGIIKYGERTWVLKSVCDDKGGGPGGIVPLDTVRHNDNAIVSEPFLNTLLLAHQRLKDFKMNIDFANASNEILDINSDTFLNSRDYVQWNDTYPWNELEVEMGLMYDMLFTKASKTYTKKGCILRSISFACTMSILVGLFWLISRKEKRSLEQDNYSMLVDIIITGLLLVGALALEIYALTMLLTSDWTMIWLIKQKRKNLVIQLGQKVPWLFPMDQKRRWSKKMGQFDLFRFRPKEKKTSMVSRVLGLLGIQHKFNKYMHKTYLDVPPNLYSMISHYLCFLSDPIATLHEQEMFKFVEDDFANGRRLVFEEQLFCLYFATENLFNNGAALNATTSQNNGNTSGGGEGGEVDNNIIRKTCQTLSRYMMSLYIECSSLFPTTVADRDFPLEYLIKAALPDIENGRDLSSEELTEGSIEGREQAQTLQSTNDPFMRYLLENKTEVERWRILKTKWLQMICYVAFKAQKNNHLQQLTQGGELLTLVWCFIAQADEYEGLDGHRIYNKFNNLRSLI